VNWTLPILLAAALLASCSTPPAAGLGLSVYQAYDRPARRPDHPGDVRVKVSTAWQRAYVMEGDRPLLVMPVTVGAPATPTPHGEFRIVRKEARHRSGSHGFARRGDEVDKTSLANKPAGWDFTGTPMPYWCEIRPGCGFHTGWIKHHPASDGCIRMHENVAPKFFELVRVGTPVEIATSQPEDAEYGSIPLPPDAGPLPDYPPSFYLGDGYFERHQPPVFE
jgi:hypothetical protein